jgi:nicotinamide mononucleotide transporter
MTPAEIIANLLNVISVLLAGRNSVHTWWTGILGCLAFAWVFFWSRLYADATLQVFFIVTSFLGWWNWEHVGNATELPIRRTSPVWVARCLALAVVSALGYGWLLKHFTDAWAPFVDSVVLTFSVLAQLLLMGRRIENWPCWFIVNTIAVPLYAVRGLRLTSALYVLFWLNSIYSFFHWRRLLSLQKSA